MISWNFSREIRRLSLAIAIFGVLCIIPCRSQRKCEPLSVSLCQGLSYNSTIFPNILGHGTQGEAALEVNQYIPLVQTECSKDLVFFLCAVYAPVCNVLNVPAPPCRSICIKARDDCRGLMEEFGFAWPAELSCDKFPRLGNNICVGGALIPTPKSAPEGFLIFANLMDISRVPFGSSSHQTVIPRQIAATGIDFDFDTGFIYWTDTYLGYMQRAPLNNSRNTQIVMRGLSSPEGLAVDWVNKKLYWTDTGTNLIGVADFDGGNRMVLVNNRLKKPRGIAVHPIIGYMFWTDWGRPAKIEKCGMDGNQTSRQVLIDRDIVWPNGLTLDYSTDRMWWTDARRGTIESSDLRGLDRKVTVRSWHIRGTFGIVVFHNFVYVTKFRTGRRILKIDKTTGKSVREASHLYSPRGILMYHRLRQPVPQGGNPCQPTGESKTCSHICLLAPRHLYPEGYSCHCPAGFALLEDHKTCNTTDSLKCKEGTCRNGGTCIERNGKTPVCRRCVMGEWRCDGYSDCPDNLGEAAGCLKCASNEFKCESILNPKCISLSWKCDGEDDCGNGSDELNCTFSSCNTDQFTCNTSGRCIPDKWKCDGDMDCPDYSDESGCDSASVCESSQFQCKDGTCVEQNWRCDGDNDCFDNSDESGCSTANASLCKSSEFQCEVGKCIPNNWRCDGQFDCSDKSDELNCSPSSCAGYEFQCGTGECIQRHRKCDGVANCKDQSDETVCYDRWCGSNKYFCSNGRCIDLDKRCDGNKDCFNGSDERDCDIEKCEIHGGCSHFCSVDEDVYKCYCNAGYSLSQDNKTCQAQGSDEILLFSNLYDIRRITFQPHSYELAALSPKGATGLDFDFEQNSVFWTDMVTKSIERMRLKNATEVDVIVKNGLNEPEGIAVDWINRKLYWTDSGAHKIEVSDLDGKKRLPLVTSRLENPRAIAVHPFVGYMFWTDWGSAEGDENPSKIEKCGMNGKNTTRQIIVKRNLGWPNGLAIDYTLNRLWWTDAKLNTIGSADLNGHHRRTVLKDTSSVKHPFGISIFQEDMYWTDWNSGKVFRANRFTGRNAVTVADKLARVMDVVVLHRQRQPEG